NKKGVQWWKMDYWMAMEECAKYGIDDVEMTWLLWQMYEQVIEERGLQEQYINRKKLLFITSRMEAVGLYTYLDGPEGLHNQIKRLTALKEILRSAVQEEVGFANYMDLNKTATVHKLLFDILALKP